MFKNTKLIDKIHFLSQQINYRHEEIASSTNDGLNVSQQVENGSHSVHVAAEKSKYPHQICSTFAERQNY